jgi:hypothetical protein
MDRMPDDALAVARAYHRAWTAGNIDEAGRRLSDGLIVEVPINDYPTKADFLRAVESTRKMTSKVDVLAEFGNTGEALLMYDMVLPITRLRVAEHFLVADGLITRIRQIHDTAALRAARFGADTAAD